VIGRDEVSAFERRLARSAAARMTDHDTGELAALFRHVAAHRQRRTGDGAAGDRVLSVEPVGSAVRIIRTERPGAFEFHAGQYTKLGVPGTRPASYSLASAPHEAHLEFCVELMHGGRVSPRLFALQAGDRVTLGGAARGRFRLEPTARTHLMVATVTGIAPLRSMLRDALHHGLRADFVVLHGASHADELPYFAELTALAAAEDRVRYLPTISRPDAGTNAGWRHDVGRVDDLAGRIAGTCEPRTTHVYACGHPGMVQRVASELGGTFLVSSEVFD
jgi:ferredoxin--NADP+ reductase